MIDFHELGSLIKENRKKQGLSQTSLGSMTGFSASYISRIENARVKPSIDAIEKIVKILKMKVKFFFDN
ncbi:MULTISPECIES: helix-turn-helix domain-containing protein [Bacillus amyloliquefaciens group]|uniref:helix-turn-helix domain-containing protein n=1 Tax=Bacillus amyloliquefaciens group TaxID=1938374 RepID=UPI000F42018C|nr:MULTISPECIES: helix-turn-helix transcriptional regulator [Bacillus amyloliquefaciens group]AYV16451.1 XRE family transcriptional regulator [Bacillus velezensis]MEC0384555.1 helix-turn-helix transcriptional regulator [Bacillus velezensis]MEC1906177.1 helix-turn-helix transcriptional regulator [Bacillus velezensis]MEC5260778.1 helix-turn-helix transcriptional regulator [Bacillus amyloliquefaciens]RXJ44688.1 XRE family transcriptional regulator [Bacillus velezensis]